MIGRNDPCWCGSGKKWKKCCWPNEGANSYDELKAAYKTQWGILLKTEEEIAGIRRACLLSAEILNALCDKAKPGVTTLELDAYARELHKKAGAVPAPLGYGDPPFPASICTSLNEVICHGIPNSEPLKEGDIVNIDVSPKLGKYFGDCSRMVCIGEVSAEAKKLVDVTYECLMGACHIVRPGAKVHEIGDVIETIAAKSGFSVVNQFVGHGVGIAFHEAPEIPHHANHSDIPLAPGMTFTIEPMINIGVRAGLMDPKNHWEARTKDGKLSAQCEHTVLVTESGYEILTPWDAS